MKSSDSWPAMLRKLCRDSSALTDARARDQVLDHYGRVCVCCGATRGLTIDHVNGDGKAHREELKGDLYRWLVQEGFPRGFQVLCTPCNSSKGAGLACRMHDATGELKRLWLGLTRDQRVRFVAWMMELDQSRLGNGRIVVPAASPAPAVPGGPEGLLYQDRPTWRRRRSRRGAPPAPPAPSAPPAPPAPPGDDEFSRLVTSLKWDHEKPVDPRHEALRRIVRENGLHGITAGRALSRLESQGKTVARETVQRWLAADEKAGLVCRGLHGSRLWRAAEFADDNAGQGTGE